MGSGREAILGCYTSKAYTEVEIKMKSEEEQKVILDSYTFDD